MEYIRRIVDDVIDKRTEAFNAVSITGPKGCGKTRTAKERCKTVIEFQDEDKRDGYIAVAETAPKLFLKNPKPILFDEWQDAVKIWGTIRKACDDSPEKVGEYYLTGSASKKISTPHTGTGRITEVTMYPMTLFETGESNGEISLSKILNEKNYDLALVGWELSLVPDATNILESIGYEDEKLTNYINSLKNATTESQIRDIYKSIQKYVNENALFMNLVIRYDYIVTNRRIEGKISPNSFDIYEGITNLDIAK